MLEVCLLGCGGMQPLPERKLTSLMVRVNGGITLIDCGEGTQVGIKESGWRFKAIDVIAFTHYHSDHVCGLPGVLLAINNSGRTDPVMIAGPRNLKALINSFRFTLPELSFPIYMYEITTNSGSIPLADTTLSYRRMAHSTPCYGYSIDLRRPGKFDLEKAKKNAINERYWGVLQKGKSIEKDHVVLTSDMILGPERKGLKVTYVTDTRPIPQITDLAKGSDLFICEGMYHDNDETNNVDKYMHMTFGEAATLAKNAEVKQLWLTHFSPSLASPAAGLRVATDIFPNTELGADGKKLTLEFEE